MSNEQMILDLKNNLVKIDDKTYRLVEEKAERPQKNPKIYTPKEVMEHLLNGGWVEDREYTNASYYRYLNDDGGFVDIFKRDDERAYKEQNPYDHDLGLALWELKTQKYFLINPLSDKELRAFGRQGVDV